MKKTGLLILSTTIGSGLYACPVCQRNQPKVLAEISHGSIPDSQWDYVIVALVGSIVLISLILSIYQLLRPGEEGGEHIKKTILNQY